MVLAISVMAQSLWAAALSQDKAIDRRGDDLVWAYVATGQVIYAGAIVAIDTNGYAQAASDVSGLKVIGVAQDRVDNREGVYDATKTIVARRSTYLFANSGSFTAANIGDWCFVSDDQTVTTAATATYDLLCGVIVGVDSTGVWVDMKPAIQYGAVAATSVAVSGAATVGGASTFSGAAAFGSSLSTTGNVTVGAQKLTVAAATGNTQVGGTFGVTGNTQLTGTFGSTGAATFSTNATVQGNGSVSGTFGVTGVTTLGGGIAGGIGTCVITNPCLTLTNFSYYTNGVLRNVVTVGP